MVNNIRNNIISEISAKEGLNALNEIKNTEIIKYKKRTPTQKELLNLFNDLLDTILTDETLMSLNENRNENGNENVNEKENEEENKEENDKTMIKQLNDCLDQITDKSKSFEDQIESIKKLKDLSEYYYINDYGNKELEFKIFKVKLANLSNIIDKKI